MTVLKTAQGKFYVALLMLCSVWIAWFRYQDGIDPVSAICRAAVMLAASVAIYELAHTRQHKIITGLHHIALSLAMLVAWFALIFIAAARSDSITDEWSLWLLIATVAISCAFQWWWRKRRDRNAVV